MSSPLVQAIRERNGTSLLNQLLFPNTKEEFVTFDLNGYFEEVLDDAFGHDFALFRQNHPKSRDILATAQNAKKLLLAQLLGKKSHESPIYAVMRARPNVEADVNKVVPEGDNKDERDPIVWEAARATAAEAFVYSMFSSPEEYNEFAVNVYHVLRVLHDTGNSSE